MPPNHQSGPQQAQQTSSDQLDARMYKFMLDMDARLDVKFKEAREQNKEDFNNMLRAEVLPVLREMNKRLEQGDAHFKDHDAHFKDHDGRLDDHSDKIKAVTKPSDDRKGTALEKRKDGWVSKLGEKVLLPAIVAALSVVVSIWLMVQIKMVAFADTTTNPPTVVQPKP